MIIDIALKMILLNMTLPRFAASLPMYKFINVAILTIMHPMMHKRFWAIDRTFTICDFAINTIKKQTASRAAVA